MPEIAHVRPEPAAQVPVTAVEEQIEPRGHCVHEPAPEAEYWPGAHVLVIEIEAQYEPAGQSAQGPWPAAEY